MLAYVFCIRMKKYLKAHGKREGHISIKIYFVVDVYSRRCLMLDCARIQAD